MPMPMMSLPLILGLALAGSAHAGQDLAPRATALNGTAWTLASLPGHAPLPEHPATLRFDAGRLSGSDGCNRFTAPYAAEGDRIMLTGPMVGTRMACPEPVTKLAQAFADALVAARTFRAAGEKLELLDASGTPRVSFTPQSQALAGTTWNVTGYNNGRQAVVSVLEGSTLTLAFADGGRLSGAAGCNRYLASYSAEGERITVGAVGGTRRACDQPEGVMAQEAAFLAALERAATLRVEGNRLELRATDGALQVTATRAGDAPAGAGRTGGAAAAHALRLPATFRGDLPCADCESIRHHLDLWPDGVFHLRREWRGRELQHDALGRWHAEPARRAIRLQDGGETPLQFEIKGPDRLRLLDRHGQPIASPLPYELASDGSLTPTELSLPLAGEMVYFADAARFTECLTGRNYPMAMEGAFLDAERAYLAARSAPAAPLYVTLEGAIVPRPKREGEGRQPTVVVNRFIAAWPNERCERAMADASLVNTYWRIVRLAGEPVGAAEGRREPHLILRGDGKQQAYTATVGCNRLAGSYALDGELIGIAPAAATRMACPAPLDALEAKLRDALDRAARWQILGNTLELIDAAGTRAMLLEAVYL